MLINIFANEGKESLSCNFGESLYFHDKTPRVKYKVQNIPCGWAHRKRHGGSRAVKPRDNNRRRRSILQSARGHLSAQQVKYTQQEEVSTCQLVLTLAIFEKGLSERSRSTSYQAAVRKYIIEGTHRGTVSAKYDYICQDREGSHQTKSGGPKA